MLKNIYLTISVLFTLIIGSLASTGATDPWYIALNKAPLNPPGYVFGIVWPILYGLMLIVAIREYKFIKNLFYIQLFFNLLWSWLFFYFQLPLISLFDILILFPSGDNNLKDNFSIFLGVSKVIPPLLLFS